ncbi:hypothetical protein K8089_04615 [Aequorivita sp. F47161]|uniref:Uncharacterized protein n=1 Tax=Aequorivita vitellina TaxID=2874475 RepID=A0A9X1U108_9FLAO|nr:hypothetical protein [Aequorivita vitellina]MCG2418295.1 hypothetical protein [Aequorivita vitellina]MCZ4319414.1 hypothetical protein [Aequorivita viscosa]
MEQISEVLLFADFVAKKYEEDILQKGIASLASNSKTYSFLKDEEDLYTVHDLKAVYK